MSAVEPAGLTRDAARRRRDGGAGAGRASAAGRGGSGWRVVARRRARPARLGRRARAAVRLQRRRERALRPERDRPLRPRLEPALLRQPAGLHVPAARRLRRLVRRARGRLERATRPTRPRSSSSRASPRRWSARSPSWLLYLAGRAALRPPRRPAGRGAAGRRVPAGLLLAPRAQRRADARADRLSLWGTAGVLRDGRAARLRCSPASASGWRARRSTRAGIVLLPLLAAGGDPPGARRPGATPRRAGSCWRASSRSAAFVVANPYAVLDFAAFRDGLQPPGRRRRRRAGQARPDPEHGSSTTCGRSPGGWAGCRSSPASSALGAARLRRPPARCSCSAPRRSSSCSSWAPRSASSGAGCCRSSRSSACSPPTRSSRLAELAGARAAPALRAGARRARRGRCCCGQGIVYSLHSGARRSRAPTRATSRARGWSTTSRRGRRSSSSRSCPTRGRSDIGHPSPATANGARWVEVPDEPLEHRQRRLARSRGRGAIVNIEDYERTLYPGLDRPLRGARATAGSSAARPSAGAPRPSPSVPRAIAYYRELERALDARLRGVARTARAPSR